MMRVLVSSKGSKGAGLVEYGLLCAVMVLGTLVAIMLFSQKTRSYYEISADVLSDPVNYSDGSVTFVLGPEPEPDWNADDRYGYSEGRYFLYGTAYADGLDLDGVYEGVLAAGEDDIMTGTSSDEIFIGGAGNDVMTGRGGADTYVIYPNSGMNAVDETGGDSSVDTLDLREISYADISAERMGTSADVKLSMASGGELVVLGYFNAGSEKAHFERVMLSDRTIEGAQGFRDFVADKQKSSGRVYGTKLVDNFTHSVATDGSYTLYEDHVATSVPLGRLTFTDAAVDDVTFLNDLSSNHYDLIIETDNGQRILVSGQYHYLGNLGLSEIVFEGGDPVVLDAQGIRSKAADGMKATGNVTATRWTEELFHDMLVDGSYMLRNDNGNADPLESFIIRNATPDQVSFAYSEPQAWTTRFKMTFEDGDVVEIYNGFMIADETNYQGIKDIIFADVPGQGDVHYTPELIMEKAMADMVDTGYVRGWRGSETVVYTRDDPKELYYYPGSSRYEHSDTLDLRDFDYADASFSSSGPKLFIRLPDDRKITIGQFWPASWTVETFLFGDGEGGTVTLSYQDIYDKF